MKTTGEFQNPGHLMNLKTQNTHVTVLARPVAKLIRTLKYSIPERIQVNMGLNLIEFCKGGSSGAMIRWSREKYCRLYKDRQ